MKNQFILDAAPNNNKVQCIKAIRTLTGLGLKEAKDLVEAAMVTPQPVNYAAYISESDRRYAEELLKEAKCILNPSANIRPRSIYKTKVLVLESVAAGDYEYAKRLLNVLIESSKEPA